MRTAKNLMSMIRRVTDKEIAKMYEKKLCNISATCTALGINRLTFYRRKEKSKTLQKLLEDAEESLLDWAETKLISHIEDGDITSRFSANSQEGIMQDAVNCEDDDAAHQYREGCEAGSDESGQVQLREQDQACQQEKGGKKTDSISF